MLLVIEVGNTNTGLGVYDTYNTCGSNFICDLLIELGLVQDLNRARADVRGLQHREIVLRRGGRVRRRRLRQIERGERGSGHRRDHVIRDPAELVEPLAVFAITLFAGWLLRRLVLRALGAWTSRAAPQRRTLSSTFRS